MVPDEEEEIACINNLLACSGREDYHKKQVSVNSWDEVGSWKSVSPMGIYKKSKKKNNTKNKSLKPLPIVKSGKYSTVISGYNSESFPYRFRVSDQGKAGHSSTNVLSYNNPSWRYIIDWKTYSYRERPEPEEARNRRNQDIKRSNHASQTDYETWKEYQVDQEADYHMYHVNPTDVIDEKIAAAYNESLAFDINNYDEEELRKHYLLRSVMQLPVAKLGKYNSHRREEHRREEKREEYTEHKSIAKEMTLCINTTAKKKKDPNKILLIKKNNKKKKKKKRHLRPDDNETQRMPLPPIQILKEDHTKTAFERYNKETGEFPFSIAQMLTTKGCTEEKQGRQIINSREEVVSSTTDKSIDFYLPTLKYGNYVHLYNDKPKKKRSRIKLPKIYEIPFVTHNGGYLGS